ncbi:CRISPR-associated protein [Sulfolobales archaeon HS-7]|nr:CRISPR-associated protein [Sulfolobales archaeon HS-7]
MKILISSIGDPRYDEVKYRLEDKEYQSKFSGEAIYQAFNPDVAIVVGQYTLAHKSSTPTNYADLKENSEKYIREKLNLSSQWKVIVSPGVYGYSDGWSYVGEIYNFYAYTLYELYGMLLNKREDLEVFLDITHGVNYIGYLTASAVQQILDAYSTGFNVRLRLFNSDPHYKSESKMVSLSLNEIVNREVKPAFTYSTLEQNVLRPARFLSKEMKEDIGKRISKEIPGEVDDLYLINAINSGALLAAYELAKDFGEVIKKSVKLFEEYVHVEQKSVYQKVAFTSKFESLIIASILREISLGDFKGDVTVSELWRKANQIYRYRDMQRTIINNELYEIKQEVEKATSTVTQDGWEPLSNFIKSQEEPDKRTFLAHAGLPGSLCEVKVEDKEVKLRYNQKGKERIRNYLRI